MTNEEAIKKLKEFKILHSEQHGFDISTLQALDIAIKALEQEFFVGEDGSLILVDDCGNSAYCDATRFKVVTESEEENDF